MSDEKRTVFKKGEWKISMTMIGYDIKDLEKCAEKNPELVAQIIAESLGDTAVTVSDPEFAERFPLITGMLNEKAKKP